MFWRRLPLRALPCIVLHQFLLSRVAGQCTNRLTGSEGFFIRRVAQRGQFRIGCVGVGWHWHDIMHLRKYRDVRVQRGSEDVQEVAPASVGTKAGTSDGTH